MGNGYYLGLDMGTGSLGWAVTNAAYEIMRAHGKALWGVRLFDGANTAEERRLFRTGRRRLDRMQWRIQLLQELFAPEINKIDSGFFLRMKESRYVADDKRDVEGNCPELPYALFVDKDFTDKDYYKKFPTIYHLRKWLMDTDETPDIRLIYLAFHHLLKHRGHFLLSSSIDNIKAFETTFMQFLQVIQDEELDFHLEMTTEKMKFIEATIKNKNISKSAKRSQLVKELGATTVCEKAILNLVVGGTAQLRDIFGDEELANGERPKLSFSDNSYEDYISAVENDLGEHFIIIEAAKAVYDWAILEEILGNYNSLSEAKISQYEKHRTDLYYLKKLVKQNLDKETYNRIFVQSDEKLCNYSAYVGVTKHNGKKVELKGKRCGKEEFYSFIKKNVIDKIKDEEKVVYLKEEMEKGTFLPKQVIKENGVIPHQVHLYELDKIMENLQEKVLLIKNEKDKIRSIFTFRIPYYVGPLNGITKGNMTTNWIERKSTGRIYPWNFEQIVDLETSAERFIRRMTNKCTYLYKEDVLPKNSLLYSKFIVLDELNNLRLDGVPISVELKQKIFDELFKRSRKVTQKKLKSFLIREGIVGRQVEITGIDGDFKGSLTAYHDFKEKLSDCILGDDAKESIILNITLFGEDKKLLNARLKKMFPNLTENQRKALCRLSYNGWGRLSRNFLEGITAPNPETGEAWTIIRTLWDSNDNLMQILSEKYKFAEKVFCENKEERTEGTSYKLVEEFPVSPSVKRQIWQTLQVVKELCKVLGEPPRRVFIEMAREDAEKKRIVSRKKMLIELYKKCKEEEKNWISELTDMEEHKFRSDKLFLYYTQKGRCMYSGEIIDLQDLWDNQKYDIDHIYPQSKVMDDSINNRVLVKKSINADKTDIYPINENIRRKMGTFWKTLEEGGFISKEKYNRLSRSTEFEPTELAGFIARQIVETRQGTKAVATILKRILPDTEIVYSKAKITAQFRQDFNLIKVREMNDLHHAKDAYLNVVVGNAYYTKFTANAAWYVRENPGRSYNLKRMFTSGQDVVRNGELAWKAGNDGTIRIVKRVMNKNNIMVTRRAYEVMGALFDQQLVKKGKGQVPIKGSDARLTDIGKYGGYNSVTGTYFMLVESEDVKGNKIRTIEYIPLYLKQQIEKDADRCQKYLTDERKLINPVIRLHKIRKDTLFKVDGFYMWLSKRTGKQLAFKGAIQLLLSNEEECILKKVLKFVERKKVNKDAKIVEYDKIKEADLENLYECFLCKLENTIYRVRLESQIKTLKEKKNNFMALSRENKCQVLSEILHMFQCQSVTANLKLIGGPDSAGTIYLNGNITKCKQISIINQSPTGIYEEEIDLRTV